MFGCLVLPKIIPFSFGESPIYAGQAAQLTCLVSEGDFPLSISWSFNNGSDVRSLGISTSQFGRMTSVLLIEDAMSKHSGKYTCTVRNPVGTASYSTFLRINGNSFVQFYFVCLTTKTI